MNDESLYQDEFIKKSDLAFYITKEDVQNEALINIKRQIDFPEMSVVKDMLEWGICENLYFIYHEIFNLIQKKGNENF